MAGWDWLRPGKSKETMVEARDNYMPPEALFDANAFNRGTAASVGTRELELAQRAVEARRAPMAMGVRLGAPAMSAGVKVTGATLDTANEMAVRAKQKELLDQLALQAKGEGPSLAGMQLKQGLEQQLLQQQSAAASQKGTNPALAMRLLGEQATTASTATQQAAAQARIQEMLGAQAALGQFSTGMRAADYQTAAGQAQLQQQALLAQAGFAQQSGMANQAAINDFLRAQAGMEQQTSLANQMAQLQTMGLNDAQARALLASRLGIDSETLNAQMARERLKVQGKLGERGLEQQDIEAEYRANQDKAKMIQNAGLAMLSMGMMSDETAKTDVRPGAEKVRAMLGALGVHDYRYKAPDAPGAGHGRFVSAMAQELERTELGRSAVIETAHGKMVDYGKLGGVMLAGEVDLHDRVAKLEAMLSADTKRRGKRAA